MSKSRFTSKESEPKTIKTSKNEKFDLTFEPEFDEEDPYRFLNDCKVKYDPKRKLTLMNFMLVYDMHIEYDIIERHIINIINGREDKRYESTYWLGSYTNTDFREIPYERTYVYIKLITYYKPTRDKFNLKYHNMKLIPCIRIIPYNMLNEVNRFIYFI